VEDWRCPSSVHPYYHSYTTSGHNDEQRHDHIISAADSRGDSDQLVAARSLDDITVPVSIVASSTREDHSLSVGVLRYFVVTVACVLLLLVVVGAASYLTAAHCS